MEEDSKRGGNSGEGGSKREESQQFLVQFEVNEFSGEEKTKLKCRVKNVQKKIEIFLVKK